VLDHAPDAGEVRLRRCFAERQDSQERDQCAAIDDTPLRSIPHPIPLRESFRRSLARATTVAGRRIECTVRVAGPLR